jgi:hypothetical protein
VAAAPSTLVAREPGAHRRLRANKDGGITSIGCGLVSARAMVQGVLCGSVMNAMKAMVVVVALSLAATSARAMTGQEFLQAYDKGASDEAAVLKPLVRQFVREGYHKVPDWADLGDMARALILEKGYRDGDIAEIAREAAIANGMSK